jgi:hypothetical protein
MLLYTHFVWFRSLEARSRRTCLLLSLLLHLLLLLFVFLFVCAALGLLHAQRAGVVHVKRTSNTRPATPELLACGV